MTAYIDISKWQGHTIHIFKNKMTDALALLSMPATKCDGNDCARVGKDANYYGDVFAP